MSRRIPYLVATAGAVVMLYGGLFGPWWLTFVGAVAIGAGMTRARIAVLAAAIIAFVGWATPLAAIQSQYGVRPAAEALAAIMGFKGATAIPLVLTLLVGVLLGASGSWLGAAARGVVISGPRSRPVQKLGDERLEVKDPVLAKR